VISSPGARSGIGPTVVHVAGGRCGGLTVALQRGWPRFVKFSFATSPTARISISSTFTDVLAGALSA
jgi:hypothetical protein